MIIGQLMSPDVKWAVMILGGAASNATETFDAEQVLLRHDWPLSAIALAYCGRRSGPAKDHIEAEVTRLREHYPLGTGVRL